MKYSVLILNQLNCLLKPDLHRISVMLLVAIFTFTSCKSDDDQSSGSGDDVFTAKVDGELYVATEIYDAGYKNNGENLFIVGANASNTIELEIAGNTEGVYPINSNTESAGLYTIRAQSASFSTLFGGSGTIHLTELTSTRMKGTFSFTVSPIFTERTPENTITITDGEFNVAIQ